MITDPRAISILMIMPIVQALPLYRAIRQKDYTNFRFDMVLFIFAVIIAAVIMMIPLSWVLLS